MPITALSEEIKQFLGSASAIATPVSLIKELVDNAIDANADAIEILISQNTIDKLEVRDNGLGIHPDDYHCLGKHGYTSKLTTIQDLRCKAGTTFGFRGEALANANNIGKITITTRSPSDSVASVLYINPVDGGVLKQQHASAPCGTTVTVSELYYNFPVREQRVLKEAKKNLDKIKTLLRSYAMARPKIKLAYKVFKSPSLSWNYSPRRDATFDEAMLQIFGREVASRCLEKTGRFTTTSECLQISTLDPSPSFFVLNATLWKPSAQLLRLPDHRFFSVDGRPVSGTRGTMQKLMSVYTKYLGCALHDRTDPKPLSNAFIRLNINCPSGFYDVNVEPTKNEVLFEDESTIIEHFEALCAEIYGPLNSHEPSCAEPQEVGPHKIVSVGTSAAVGTSTNVTAEADASSGACKEMRHKMNSTNGPFQTATQVLNIQRLENPELAIECRESRGSTRLMKPLISLPSAWAPMKVRPIEQKHKSPEVLALEDNIAKLHENMPTPNFATNMSTSLSEGNCRTAWRGKHNKLNSRPATALSTATKEEESVLQLLNPSSTNKSNTHTNWSQHHTNSQDIQFPTLQQPIAFSMTPEPEILLHRGAPPRDLEIPPSFQYRYHHERDTTSNVAYGGRPVSPISSPGGQPDRTGKGSLHRRVQSPWTPPSSVQKDHMQQKNRRMRKSQTRLDGMKQTTLSFEGSQHPGIIQPIRGHGKMLDKRMLPTDESQGLQRNIPTACPGTQQHHLYNSPLSVGVGFSLSSPASHRRAADKPEVLRQNAFAPLHSTNLRANTELKADEEFILSSTTIGDPTGNLISRQNSATDDEGVGKSMKHKRMESRLLPLENTIAHNETREVTLLVDVSVQNLPICLSYLKKYDMYIMEGDIEEALDMGLGEARRVEKQLDFLLSSWSEKYGERISVSSNLGAILMGKGVEIGK
jgi:DNA mismatch repair protein MutL